MLISNIRSYKEYDFDYIIEYKSVLNGNDNSVFYLTNSRDNEYFAVLTAASKDTIRLKFYKHNSIRLQKKIHKKEFYSSKIIDLKRPKAHYSRRIKFDKKDSFEIQSDTILEGKSCNRYIYKSLDIHDFNLSIQYSIEPQTSFHLPILTVGESFLKWKKNQNIPPGIFNEMFFLDDNNKIVEAHYKLVNYQTYDKVVRIKY